MSISDNIYIVIEFALFAAVIAIIICILDGIRGMVSGESSISNPMNTGAAFAGVAATILVGLATLGKPILYIHWKKCSEHHLLFCDAPTPSPVPIPPPPVPVPSPPVPVPPPNDVALKTIKAYFQALSLPSAEVEASLTPLYANAVQFHGHENVPKALIISRKIDFAALWPARNFSIKDQDVDMRCQDSNTCVADVDANVGIENPAQGTSEEGVVHYRFRLNAALIVGETSKMKWQRVIAPTGTEPHSDMNGLY